MCQPSAIADNNMPPSAILGTYHHFRTSSWKQFTQAIIWFSLWLLSGLPSSDSTTFCLNDLLNCVQTAYTLLDCELVKRVLWWYSASTAVRGAKLLSRTNGESKLLLRSTASCSYRWGVQEMMVEVKCTLPGSEIPPYSYHLFRA